MRSWKRIVGTAVLVASSFIPTPAVSAHGHPPRPIRHYLPPLFVTGYDQTGYTASGVWTHPGTCASDWRYIPRGAHVHIPGLGICHVEDSGGAIVGWRVDWWFPTASQCYEITGWYAHAYWTR